MSYKVLYRKYRPNSFSEVVGQEATVKILKNSIINEKISHAYLFSGPRGTGKTSLARIFAKVINCLNPKDGEACGECQNCLNFGSNPDIIEIDAASNNGVDEIRELINNVKLMPSSAKYKVYIIDEVHMLSQSAFNALLLTLEEPPSHVIFILATTNLESVPITIVSRCQKFEFYRIGEDLITKQLQNICEKEKIKYDLDGLKEITALADGGMRDALSMLDQLSKEGQKIDLDLVIKELGSISLIKIKDLVQALDDGNTSTVVEIINDLKKTNINYKIVVKKIIELLSQKAVDVLENNSENYLTYREIKRIILELNDELNKININVNPYIIIQMILLDNETMAANSVPIKESKVETETGKNEPILAKETIVKEEPAKPEKKEDSLDNKPKKETQINNEFLKEIRVNNCFVAASKEDLNHLKDNWHVFQEECPAKLKGLLMDTVPVASSPDNGILMTNIEHQCMEINNEIANIEKEYRKKFKQAVKLICLANTEWEAEKQEFIKNKNNGYKYELKSEEELKKENSSEIEQIANDIFNGAKIEIK